MKNEIEKLNDKIDYLTKIIEIHIEESKPCGKNNQKKKNDLLKILESSPIAKHPVFAQMMGPLKDILNKV